MCDFCIISVRTKCSCRCQGSQCRWRAMIGWGELTFPFKLCLQFVPDSKIAGTWSDFTSVIKKLQPFKSIRIICGPKPLFFLNYSPSKRDSLESICNCYYYDNGCSSLFIDPAQVHHCSLILWMLFYYEIAFLPGSRLLVIAKQIALWKVIIWKFPKLIREKKVSWLFVLRK